MKPRLWLIALLFCAGCATSYKADGLTGGFSETALAPDMYRVRFDGNGYTKPDRAADFALLRACELCLKDGYTFFVVLDQTSDGRVIDYTLPQTTNVRGTVTTLGNQSTLTGTAISGPAVTTHIRMPSAGMVVKLFKTKPGVDSAQLFDAQWLQTSLKTKYGVKS